MTIQVCMGATMTCSFGMAPSSLVVIRPQMSTAGMPLANIMDNKPFVNILPFGLCMSLANPAVAAATAAALGVLTPQPCTPVIPAPWVPGIPTILLDKMPDLSKTSILMCAYAGIIQIVNPGQFTVLLPM